MLTKNVDEEGHFYLFPGGGQDHGEVLFDTVKRECIEEIGENTGEDAGPNHLLFSFM